MSLSVADFLQDQVVLRSEGVPLQPLVSVVLPTYARLKSGLMPRAVESVLKQTLTDIELIIVDDGSTDGSNEYIEELRTRDSRVVHVRHENNSGLPGLRCNEAIEIARGRYVAFQFDDDFWYPHALKTLVNAAERRAEPSVTVGRVRWSDSSGKRTVGGVLPESTVNLDTLFRANQIANCSVLLPRSIFERHGMYDPHLALRRVCDWDLWVRLIERVPFVTLDEFIGVVDSGKSDSIGKTIAVDASTVRFFQQIPRGDLLTPSHWRNYVVDALTIGNVTLPELMAQRTYDDQFVPYYSRFRHNYPQIEGFTKNAMSTRRNGVVIAPTRSASNYLIVEGYDLLASRRGSIKAYQEYIRAVDPHDLDSADLVNFLRVYDPIMDSIVKQLPADVSTAYTMDDDFLRLHEVDHHPEYKPGHPYQAVYAHALSQVDAVWCATEPIRESVHAANPRTLRIPGAIPAEWLPCLPLRPSSEGRLRIFYAGGSHRKREFEVVWAALQKVAHDYAGQLEFEFWGLDISAFPDLGAPVKAHDFTLSYLEYVARLRDAQFHVMLVPLFDSPEFYRGKANPKYQECAIAGSFGIFSDVLPYHDIPRDFSCLKAENTIAGWEGALRRAIEMPAEERDRLRENCVLHVRETRTVETQIGFYEAAWRATELHALTRNARQDDGRPCIVYAMDHVPTDFHELTALIELAGNYSFVPLVVLTGPTPSANTQRLEEYLTAHSIVSRVLPVSSSTRVGSTPDAHDSLESLLAMLEEVKPVLVHDLASSRDVARACRSIGMPYVHCLDPANLVSSQRPEKAALSRAGLAYTSSFTMRSRFSTVKKTRVFYLHAPASPCLFESGLQRSVSGSWSEPVRILVAGHSTSQLPELAKAQGQLQAMGINCRLELFGETADPADDSTIQPPTRHEQVGELMPSGGNSSEVALQHVDMLLFMGSSEAFPHIVREAMAASVFVLALASEVIQEHVQSHKTGLLLSEMQSQTVEESIHLVLGLSKEDRTAILHRARKVAIDEFHPHQAAINLLTLYQTCINQFRSHSGGATTVHKGVGLHTAGSFIEQPGDPPIAPVRIHGLVGYVVRPSWDYWNGMEILVGTHQRSARGTLHLAIYELGGPLVRHVSLPLESCGDNQWALFSFEPLHLSADQDYRCELALKGVDRQTRVSFYETSRANTLSLFHKALWRAGVPQDRTSLAVRFHYSQ